MNREPEALASLIDMEASKLVELIPEEHVPRTRADVARSLFYMIAVDEHLEYIRKHPLTPAAVERKRAEINEKMLFDDWEPKPLPRVKSSPTDHVLALDYDHLNNAMSIALIQETTLGQALRNSATHYFDSRLARS